MRERITFETIPVGIPWQSAVLNFKNLYSNEQSGKKVSSKPFPFDSTGVGRGSPGDISKKKASRNVRKSLNFKHPNVS